MPSAQIHPHFFRWTITLEISQLPIHKLIWQETLTWSPTESDYGLFQQLYGEILIANQHLNLTRITEPIDFWEKHLWDSLAGIIPLINNQTLTSDTSLKLLDIGTGAGFPGIPISICFPNWYVCLLDSKQKKINFLDQLTQQLALNNTETVAARAEALGKQQSHRKHYDVVTIRAVSNPVQCLKYALPLLKIGGIAIFYRGHWREEEQTELEIIGKKLGTNIEQVVPKRTPLSKSVRHWVYFRKNDIPENLKIYSAKTTFQ